MSVGFRKSLLGFNCDDVLKYIEKSHKQFSEKELILNEKIDELDHSLASVTTRLEEVLAAKAIVDVQLKEYTDKYDEIERLSQNIGKLYLVAQSNSKAIMQNSTESNEVCRLEIEKNLTYIDLAHDSLNELKSDIVQTSADFVNKVEALVSSLKNAREKIADNNDESASLANDFDNLYADVVQ